MDDQNKPHNDLYNNDSGLPQYRPLTSFLQAKAAVKTAEEEDDSSKKDEMPADEKPFFRNDHQEEKQENVSSQETDNDSWSGDSFAGSGLSTEEEEPVATESEDVPDMSDDFNHPFAQPAEPPKQEDDSNEAVSGVLFGQDQEEETVRFDNFDEPQSESDLPELQEETAPETEEENDDMAAESDSVSEEEVESPSSVRNNVSDEENLTEIDSNKLQTALKALRQVEQQIATVIKLLETGDATEARDVMTTVKASMPMVSPTPKEDMASMNPIDGRVVEGVFDGKGMVGSDGKNYMVPPNYASKSKLVEGDMLKLTITPKGSFIYKQIGPIERSRLIGTLGYDQTIGEFYATSENRRWNVIKASVTYFKGEPGDEVVLLVPKNAPSKWAAVENIIKRNPLS